MTWTNVFGRPFYFKIDRTHPGGCGCGPFLEVLQYQANPWSGQSELRAHDRGPKRGLIIWKVTWTFSKRSNSEEQILHLILAQRAEKRWRPGFSDVIYRLSRRSDHSSGCDSMQTCSDAQVDLHEKPLRLRYSGFSSVSRMNLSPFTKDFRGPERNNESYWLFFTSQVFRPRRQHKLRLLRHRRCFD